MTEKIKKIQSLLKSESLFGRSLRGSALLSIGSLADHFGRFLRNIILARLLAAEDFGIMATIIAAISAIEAFAEVGLKQSVIHNKEGAKKEFLNIIWWISSFRGILLYLIAVIAAPIISHLYARPEATDFLRIGFTVFVFNGLISPGVHALEKELRFKRWVILMHGAGLIGVAVAIILGFFMKNVWALVIAFTAEAFLRFIFSFVICPFRPSMSFNRSHAYDIFKYSRGMFGLPILMMIYVQTDIFVVGKVISLSILGKYALAKTISEIPTSLCTRIIHPVLLPALSAMQDDLEKFRTTLVTMTRTATIFMAPVFSFLVAFSGPILSLLYGKEYVEMAGPLSILSVSYLMTMFTGMIMLAYLAIGRPNLQRNASLVRTLVLVILIYPLTVRLGALGASLAIVIAISASLLVQLSYVHKLIGLAPSQYFKSWIPGLRYSLIVIIPAIPLKLSGKFQGIEMLGIGIVLCIVSWSLAIIRMWSFSRKSLIIAP